MLYPGGITEISRGLSECDTPGSRHERKFVLHPGGMTDEAASSGVNVMIPTRTIGGHLFFGLG
jgi:hypothetical protein